MLNNMLKHINTQSFRSLGLGTKLSPPTCIVLLSKMLAFWKDISWVGCHAILLRILIVSVYEPVRAGFNNPWLLAWNLLVFISFSIKIVASLDAFIHKWKAQKIAWAVVCFFHPRSHDPEKIMAKQLPAQTAAHSRLEKLCQILGQIPWLVGG